MLGGGVGTKLRNRFVAGRPQAARRLPGGRRTRWAVGGAAAAALVGLIAWLVWPEPDPEPRAREYRDATACLLTGASGVTDPAAAPVWAGMQAASLSTRGKVQFLEVDGPQTADRARTYLATLITSRCDLILGAGEAAGAAVSAGAPEYPDVQFIAVGAGAKHPNLTVVSGADDATIRRTVESLVTEGLSDAGAD